MKPQYKAINVTMKVDTGYKAVKRALGRVVGVYDDTQGFMFGVPGVHDAALVDVQPRRRVVPLDLQTKDNRHLRLNSQFVYAVTDPLEFMRGAPTDFDNVLANLVKEEAEQRAPAEYTLELLSRNQRKFSDEVEASLDAYVRERSWGLGVDSFRIPEFSRPGINPARVEERGYAAEVEGPKRVAQAELDKQIANIRAAAAAEVYKKGERARIEVLADYLETHRKWTGEMLTTMGEAVTALTEGGLESTEVYAVLSQAFTLANATGQAPDTLRDAILSSLQQKYEGKGVGAFAQHSGVNPNLQAVAQAVEAFATGARVPRDMADLNEMLRQKSGL